MAPKSVTPIFISLTLPVAFDFPKFMCMKGQFASEMNFMLATEGYLKFATRPNASGLNPLCAAVHFIPGQEVS